MYIAIFLAYYKSKIENLWVGHKLVVFWKKFFPVGTES